MRIAIGGFQHETNTFAPSKATFDDFQRDGGWPGLRRGGDILDTMVARNVPIAGFIAQMKGSRHALVPTAWAGEMVLRICVVNPLTTVDDIHLIIDSLR